MQYRVAVSPITTFDRTDLHSGEMMRAKLVIGETATLYCTQITFTDLGNECKSIRSTKVDSIKDKSQFDPRLTVA